MRLNFETYYYLALITLTVFGLFVYYFYEKKLK